MNEIEEARKRARLTVDEFCELVGISRSAYYRKIKDISSFSVKEIDSICKALKLRPSIFFKH